MKSFFRVLIAIAVVCALLVGQRGPKVYASSPIATAKDADRDALVALYEDTDGDNWTNNRNWLSNASLDSWHGVTTDRNGRVVELNLSENELNGTIPSELGSLTYLVDLNLSQNQLRGTIPSELGNLTNLTSLSLFGNRLSGGIPSELGNLIDLVVLALMDNNLRGTIPIELAGLDNLRWLLLFGNQLSGSIPSELSRLTSLEWLYLSDNRLSGTIPSQLGNLTNLQRLILWGNQLSGRIPPELGNLTNLTSLHLGGNQLNGSIPSQLGNLTNLESLGLWGNELSGNVPPELENLFGLAELYLAGNQLRGCLPEIWRDVEETDLADVGLQFCSDRDVLVTLYEATDGDNWLENRNWLSNRPIGDWYGVSVDDSGRVIGLYLSENEMSGTIPPELGYLTKLEELDLAKNQLRGTIPPELGNLPKLTLLYLYSNQLSGSIPVELGSFSKLEQLVLSWNRLDGTIPLALSKLSELEMLVLSGNRLSGTIPSELGNLTKLKFLALHVNRLTGRIPPQLNTLSGLEWLFLADNRLTGCVPEVWQDVEENDLDEVDLPICTEEGALIALYQATDGDNWVSNQNWLSNRPIGTWYGVITDENDRVVELDLSENELNGTIPSELGYLTYLEALYLSENQLSGTIPPALGILSYLIELSLWSNELTGSIPSELSRLANLEMLHLGANELSGSIPPELGNLTNLAELGLYSNKLTGVIPAELGNLTNLEWLALTENRLSGPIPPELGNLTNLEWLALTENRLSGPIPAELDKLTNLIELYLGQNELSGTIPAELGNLTNLEQLFLHSNQLSGEIPSELGHLTKLTALSLWGNGLSGTMPSELGNLTKLIGLGLADNKLSGDIPPELGRLSKLEQLYLSGNRLGGCVPAVLENVEGNDFEELELPFCFATASTTSTSATTAEQVSSARIFEMVSPAIAYIHTGISSGSGVLVEGGYVVTNAHVVWPFDTVRVAFPDGTAIRDVPVIGWDLLVDLAVLGPVPVHVEPVPLLDGENIPIGSEVYLIGYPAEVEAYPQTTMTRGILSRLREWEPVGITYFQTDAAITGGQSGGALVSETGAVIGISGFRAFVEFGLAASSADLLPRVRQLIAGGDPSGLGKREFNRDGGARLYRLTSRNYGDAYIISEPAGTAIEIRFTGAEDVGFQILDKYGNEHADTETGSLSFVTRGYGPLFLIPSYVSGEVTLESSHSLVQFDDPDRGRRIKVGEILHGNIDFPTNVDYFFLYLEKDEKVEIIARSILANTRLTVWGYQGETLEVWIRDENSGGGLFGGDARIVFQAPFTGEYYVDVANVHSRSYAPAGYLVSVDQARAAASLTPLRPWVTIITPVNVREGPGTNYAVIGTAAPGASYVITGKSPGLGDWWQINLGDRTGWVYGPLVSAINSESVQVVAPPNP